MAIGTRDSCTFISKQSGSFIRTILKINQLEIDYNTPAYGLEAHKIVLQNQMDMYIQGSQPS